MDILTLPFELLVAVIAQLHPKDILAFCLVCRYAQDVYRRSFYLQYRTALFATGKHDSNHSFRMNVRERLTYAYERESLWRSLRLDGNRLVEIAINHRQSHVHDLTAGLYIFGDLSLSPDNLRAESLRFVRLPTCTHSRGPDHIANLWTEIPTGVEAICIGLSLEENDLLAILTSVPLVYVNSLTRKSEMLIMNISRSGIPARMCSNYICAGSRSQATIIWLTNLLSSFISMRTQRLIA